MWKCRNTYQVPASRAADGGNVVMAGKHDEDLGRHDVSIRVIDDEVFEIGNK